MTPYELVYYVIFFVQRAFALVTFIMSAWAFFDAVRATDYAYQSAFKRTKSFWVAITAGCALFSLLGLFYGMSLFIQLIVVVAAGVFLADVRPAVTVRRR